MLRFNWPPSELSPNARIHRMAKARVAKSYRNECGWLARAGGAFPHDAEALHVSITFCPPDNRRRDLDNMLASFKSGLDGLCDAVGVDDSKWSLSLRKGAVEAGGAVLVEVSEQ